MQRCVLRFDIDSRLPPPRAHDRCPDAGRRASPVQSVSARAFVHVFRTPRAQISSWVADFAKEAPAKGLNEEEFKNMMLVSHSLRGAFEPLNVYSHSLLRAVATSGRVKGGEVPCFQELVVSCSSSTPRVNVEQR
eukprot:SAG31_NODE_3214_length_4535_cov_2.601306_3_plen_135_part_00